MTEPFKITDRRGVSRSASGLIVGGADREFNRMRRLGQAGLPNSPFQAKLEAKRMGSVAEQPGSLSENTRAMAAQMRRSRMSNMRRTGANMEMAMPKVRVPLSSLQDKQIPWNMANVKEQEDCRTWARLFYATHDLIPLLVDIYAKFPVTGLEFQSDDPKIEQFYTQMFMDELNYEEFLPDALGREYFISGEVTTLAHFNEQLGVWSSEEVLNPDMVRVSKSIFRDEERVQLLVKDMVEALRTGPGGMTDKDESHSERMERNWEYCLTPGHRVLTADLRWVPVRSLRVGDKIIGFDEFAPPGRGRGRSWRDAEVTATSIISAPTFEVKTSGPSITCTGEHAWLVNRPYSSGVTVRKWTWIKTKDLLPGDQIRYMGEAWDQEDSQDVGYVSGIFDGEGWLESKCNAMGFDQNPGPVLDKAVEILERYKFSLSKYPNSRGTMGVQILGGVTEIMRCLGTFRPVRLLPKFTALDGRTLSSSSGTQVVEVASVEPRGVQDVVALATSTKTLMAEGMFSHNTELCKNYPEIIKAAAQDDGLDISEALWSRIVNRAAPWDQRGTPFLLRSFRTLMMEESLNAAQDSVADRLYSPLILATLGIQDMGDGEPWIPDQSELDDLREDMQVAFAADFKLMCHHFGLQITPVFGRETVPRFDQDYDRIDLKLMQAWGIGQALIMGGAGAAGTYASSALNREVCENLMSGFQKKVIRHMRKRMEIIAEAQEHYETELKGGRPRPVYREVVEEDPETGEERIVRVPKLKIPEVKFRCVVPGTQVLTPTGQCSIEDIQPGNEVIAWDGNGYVVDTALHTGVEYRESLVEVTTMTGRSIRCTDDHPFWTNQGWVQAADLTTESLVRTSAGQLTAQIELEDDLDLLRFLGLLVGDGNYSTTHVSLSVSDPAVDKFACEIAERLGLMARKKIDTRTDKVWNRCFTRPSPWKGNVLRNPLHTLLREQGMWGKNGHTKRVPPMVWAAGEKGRAAFLSGYFDADGYACRTSGLKICSVNRALLDDCQVLFESLGIRAQVHSYKYLYDQKIPNATSVNHLTVSNNHYFQMLHDTLSPIISTKIDALDDMARPTMQGRKAPRSVEWDQVTAVRPIGGGDIVILGIAKTHTHVTAGLVSHNTLNLRDEATERQFITSLKEIGVPVSDKSLAVNLPIDWKQELQRQAEETVDKLVAEGEAMDKAQKVLDEKGMPYPAELAQYLTQTLVLRQQLAQTKLLETQSKQADQMMDQGSPAGQLGLLPGTQAQPGMPGGPPAVDEDGNPIGPPGGPEAAGPVAGGADGAQPDMGGGVSDAAEPPRNRARPPESDEMRAGSPRAAKMKRAAKRKGGEIRPLSKFEKGPSSYGHSFRTTEAQVEAAVTRRDLVARHPVPRVSDLVNDPEFYRLLNMGAYEGQIQADWPEVQAGGAQESAKLLHEMIEQYQDVTGITPDWN